MPLSRMHSSPAYYCIQRSYNTYHSAILWTIVRMTDTILLCGCNTSLYRWPIKNRHKTDYWPIMAPQVEHREYHADTSFKPWTSGHEDDMQPEWYVFLHIKNIQCVSLVWKHPVSSFIQPNMVFAEQVSRVCKCHSVQTHARELP